MFESSDVRSVRAKAFELFVAVAIRESEVSGRFSYNAICLSLLCLDARRRSDGRRGDSSPVALYGVAAVDALWRMLVDDCHLAFLNEREGG